MQGRVHSDWKWDCSLRTGHKVEVCRLQSSFMWGFPVSSTIHHLSSRHGQTITTRNRICLCNVCPTQNKCGLVQVINQVWESWHSMILLRYVSAEPKWAKQLEGEVKLGHHSVTFTAASPPGENVPFVMCFVLCWWNVFQSANCTMNIHIKDTEPPRVISCPHSFEETLSRGQMLKKIRLGSFQK